MAGIPWRHRARWEERPGGIWEAVTLGYPTVALARWDLLSRGLHENTFLKHETQENVSFLKLPVLRDDTPTHSLPQT